MVTATLFGHGNFHRTQNLFKLFATKRSAIILVMTKKWCMYFIFQTEQELPAKGSLMDFAVAAQYIHGKESSSPVLGEVKKAIPDWIFANTWVVTYKSWSFTT